MPGGQIYDKIGLDYRAHRQPDPRIAAQIRRALGNAKSVLNVGAGAGSYEPSDVRLVAVEPSGAMVRQRSSTSAPCVRAVAEALPFDDQSFDAALAILTVHHWPPRLAEGLCELRRVARERVVIMTWDPDFEEDFWLTRDYLPEIMSFDRSRFPSLDTLAAHLGVPIEVEPIPIPHDCLDGFRNAYWRRPRAYLDPEVRKSISALAQLDQAVVARAMSKLEEDLACGAWENRNHAILPLDTLSLGNRIVTAVYGNA
jgi:SAM-dependent methyltransferase